jgi:hypothetical protein
MMSWLTTFRDDYFLAYPELYVAIVIGVSVCTLFYVYKFETKQAAQHRKDNYRPFK